MVSKMGPKHHRVTVGEVDAMLTPVCWYNNFYAAVSDKHLMLYTLGLDLRVEYLMGHRLSPNSKP